MTTINQLPAKFDQYMLNGNDQNSQKRALRDSLDKIFLGLPVESPLRDTSFTKLSDSSGTKHHVVTHPALDGWIIKAARMDRHAPRMAHDTHIYRVRKATKLENLFQSDPSLNSRVPKKYLYKLPNGTWIVVVEKLNLQPFDKENVRPHHAKALALALAKTGLADVYSHNVAYDEKGSLVFFDTEPRTRDQKKMQNKLGFFSRFALPLVRQITSEISLVLLYRSIGHERIIKPILNDLHSKFRNTLLLQIAFSTIATATAAFMVMHSPIAVAIPLFCLTTAIALERIYRLANLLYYHHYIQTNTFYLQYQCGL